MSRLNFVPYLQGILDEKESAAYYGGTLSWGIENEYTVGLNMDGKGFLIINGVEKIITLTPEEHLLVAKNYLKWKNADCSFWNQAQEIINKELSPCV